MYHKIFPVRCPSWYFICRKRSEELRLCLTASNILATPTNVEIAGKHKRYTTHPGSFIETTLILLEQVRFY